MMNTLRLVIWNLIFLAVLFLGMFLGLTAPFGLGRAVFGDAVTANTPVTEMPLGWFIIGGMIPCTILGTAAAFTFVVLPVAAIFRIPILNSSGWQHMDHFYAFLKRSPNRVIDGITEETGEIRITRN